MGTDPGPYTLLDVSPDHLPVLDRFLYEAEYSLIHVEHGRIADMLRRQEVFALSLGDELACVIGVAIGPQTVAHIRVFALHHTISAKEALNLLLPSMSESLSARGVTTVAFTGLDEWLLAGLEGSGFRLAHHIMTMQKTDFKVPSQGNLSIAVRPVRDQDLSALVGIDEQVFDPLWRNTTESLSQQQSESPWFYVAEHNWTVIAYQNVSLIGRHGHITRIAVHPHYQRKQVGARLLAEGIAYLERKQVFGITLNTQQENAPARRLYEWFGFQELGREAQVMVLELPCLPSPLQV